MLRQVTFKVDDVVDVRTIGVGSNKNEVIGWQTYNRARNGICNCFPSFCPSNEEKEIGVS